MPGTKRPTTTRWRNVPRTCRGTHPLFVHEPGGRGLPAGPCRSCPGGWPPVSPPSSTPTHWYSPISTWKNHSQIGNVYRPLPRDTCVPSSPCAPPRRPHAAVTAAGALPRHGRYARPGNTKIETNPLEATVFCKIIARALRLRRFSVPLCSGAARPARKEPFAGSRMRSYAAVRSKHCPRGADDRETPQRPFSSARRARPRGPRRRRRAGFRRFPPRNRPTVPQSRVHR